MLLWKPSLTQARQTPGALAPPCHPPGTSHASTHLTSPTLEVGTIGNIPIAGHRGLVSARGGSSSSAVELGMAPRQPAFRLWASNHYAALLLGRGLGTYTQHLGTAFKGGHLQKRQPEQQTVSATHGCTYLHWVLSPGCSMGFVLPFLSGHLIILLLPCTGLLLFRAKWWGGEGSPS